MSGRILYFTVVGILGLLVAGVTYKLVIRNDGSSTARSDIWEQRGSGKEISPIDETANPDAQKDSEKSAGLGSSIWSDTRLKSISFMNDGPSIKDPITPEIQVELEKLSGLYARGEDEQYLKKLDELISEHPKVKHYVALKGDYHVNSGNLEEAQAAVEKLVAMDPDNHFAASVLAEIQGKRGKYDEAMSTLDKVLEKNPSNVKALYTLLQVTESKGEPDEGMTKIEGLHAKHPDDARITLVYSDVLFVRQDAAKRDQVIENGLNKNPNNSMLLRLGAENAMSKNDLSKAWDMSVRSAENESIPSLKAESFQLAREIAEQMKDADKQKWASAQLDGLKNR